MRITIISVLPIFVLLFWRFTEPVVVADPTLVPKTNSQTNGSGVLQGRLLKIEGESYTVKDAAGKEVLLRVGKDTLVDGRIKVGDKIDAQVGPEGYALTVLKATE